VISRFGAMFFADRALGFADMRKALKPAGWLVFACWREPRLNPWLMLPLKAAARRWRAEQIGQVNRTDRYRTARTFSHCHETFVGSWPDARIDVA
jgi:hypothetical protein